MRHKALPVNSNQVWNKVTIPMQNGKELWIAWDSIIGKDHGLVNMNFNIQEHDPEDSEKMNEVFKYEG